MKCWTCLMLCKVVKINVMHPFCVGHHIDVCPNMFIMSSKIDIGKSLVIHNYLCYHWWPKTYFNHQTYDNRKFSIITWLATKNFPSPFFQCVIVALSIPWKNILKKKKNYENSNISPSKNIIFRKNFSKKKKNSFKIS